LTAVELSLAWPPGACGNEKVQPKRKQQRTVLPNRSALNSCPTCLFVPGWMFVFLSHYCMQGIRSTHSCDGLLEPGHPFVTGRVARWKAKGCTCICLLFVGVIGSIL
jgi:hypothetical protein